MRERHSRSPGRAPSSSAAATSSASRWRCCCCSATRRSPSATRGRRTWPRSPREADILVAAVGRPGFVTPDVRQAGRDGHRRRHQPRDRSRPSRSALFPAGIDAAAPTSSAAGRCVVGDVHPEVAEVAGALTPVPGGVGPLTIADAAEEHRRGRGSRSRRRRDHAARGADRRHRDRQVLSASRGSRRSAPPSSTPTSSRARPSRRHSRAGRGRRAVRQRPAAGRRQPRPRRARPHRLQRSRRAADLEAIVHPASIAAIGEWFAICRSGTPRRDRRHPAALRDRPPATTSRRDRVRLLAGGTVAPPDGARRLSRRGRARAPRRAVADRRRRSPARTTRHPHRRGFVGDRIMGVRRVYGKLVTS